MKTTLPLLALLAIACTPPIPQIELPGNDLGEPSADVTYPTALRYSSAGALWLVGDGSRAFRWDGAHWSEPGAPQFGLSSANQASLMRHGDQLAALVHTQEGPSPRLRIFDGTDWSDLVRSSRRSTMPPDAS